MVVGKASHIRPSKSPKLFTQMIETFFLVFLNPDYGLVQKIQLAMYILIVSHKHWSLRLLKYMMILLELVRNRNWYFATHVCLLEVLEDCQLFVHRGKAEKVFWSFILADGLVASADMVFWNTFCQFIIGYLVASHVFFEFKIFQAILQNIIFVGFNLYLLVVHWHYVLFLLKYKLLMIIATSAIIFAGVALVNKAKRSQSIKLTITRKYFHLLALILFLPMIIREVE